jgi:ATP-dependent Clp protease ATP-binding subunit ClpA
MRVLRESFRPEFLNRIDEVIMFEPLSEEDLDQIVDIQMDLLGRRLRDRDIRIELTPAAKRMLIEEGYDPSFGARPLKPVIQKEILDRTALSLLKAEFGEHDTVRVDVVNHEFALTRVVEGRGATVGL